MSAVQRQVVSTAFTGQAAVYRSLPQPAQRAVPAPETLPAPAMRPRFTAQTLRMAKVGLVALVAVSLGLAYLACCARVTREGYRKANLLNQVKDAREVAQRWRHQRALIYTPTTVETKASLQNMVRTDERETVVIR